MTMMGQAVSAPPWGNLPASGIDVSGGDMPYLFAALRQNLPCNDLMGAGAEDEDEDEFRMYDFKVRRCARRGSHDWTDCPFAHPGEKARRRDPRKHHYSGTACPDFRKAGCSRGDACEYAHGVFECWLHPARYRTQPCKDGTACRRRVCFFAHTADQRRAMPSQHSSSPRSKPLSPLAVSYDGSPLRRMAFKSYLSNSIMPSSPTGTLVSSPPMSPLFPEGAASVRPGSWPGIGSPVDEVIDSLRQLHLAKAQASPSGKWSANPGSPAAYGSPTTPLSAPTKASSFMANMKPLKIRFIDDDEPIQRVESGRALREKVSERLSRDGATAGRCETGAGARGPDVAWVFDLIN